MFKSRVELLSSRSLESRLPRGSIYTTIMEFGPKRPSLYIYIYILWFLETSFHNGSIYGPCGLVVLNYLGSPQQGRSSLLNELGMFQRVRLFHILRFVSDPQPPDVQRL